MWFLSWSCLWAAPAGGEPGHPVLQMWLPVPPAAARCSCPVPLQSPSSDLFEAEKQQQRSPCERSGPDYAESTGAQGKHHPRERCQTGLWKGSFVRKQQAGASFPLGPQLSGIYSALLAWHPCPVPCKQTPGVEQHPRAVPGCLQSGTGPPYL